MHGYFGRSTDTICWPARCVAVIDSDLLTGPCKDKSGVEAREATPDDRHFRGGGQFVGAAPVRTGFIPKRAAAASSVKNGAFNPDMSRSIGKRSAARKRQTTSIYRPGSSEDDGSRDIWCWSSP